jgi:hypothetical protein
MTVSSNPSPRMLPRLVPALVCLTMLGAGCSQQKAPAQQSEEDRQALAADSLHMARLYSQWQQQVASQGKDVRKGESRAQMPIDLADDAQFGFVKNRLAAAGNTPENSPQLFHRLEKARKDKKSGTPGKTTRKDMLTATDASDSQERAWCGHILPLNDVASGDASVARFQATSLVSCFDGSDYAYADVTAFATNREQTRFRVLGSQALEEYAGTVLETPPVDFSVKADSGEMLVVDSVAMAFDEATGETHFSYAMTEAPVMTLGMRDYNLLAFKHPTPLIGWHQADNPIRTCLERGAVAGFMDCDYASGSKDPSTGLFRPFARPYTGIAAVDAEVSLRTDVWTAARGDYWEPAGGYDASHLYLPMRGEYLVTVPSDCTLEALTSDVMVVLMERGGMCAGGTLPGTAVARGSLPFKTPYNDGYDPTLTRVPIDGLVDFGKDCLTAYQNVRLMVRSTLKAKCTTNHTSLDGGPYPYTRSRYIDIYNLDFNNACLAEGTRVTKADGQTVPVEQVKRGDKLLANDKGLVLTVTAVSRGGESKPMVKLRDDQGGEALVTATHPMVTVKRGVVQAGELKTGEALRTRTGTATLVGVERVPYSGDVYNFALGTPEELASVGPEARTMYANGYLVGDSQMQTGLEKQRAREASEVLTKLDKAWHEDFQRHQAHQARQARR